MSYKPQRTFNGTQGNPSTDTMGPEQLSHDIDELCKMFNPNAVHSGGEAGGVSTENMNISGLDINDIGGVASTDIKIIRVKTNGDIEYSTDGTTYHPAFAREDNYLPKAGGTMTGNIAMGSNKVTGLGTPTDSTDASTKAYADGLYDALVTALALKANLASPTFTGTPLAPTADPSTNNTQIATTAFAQNLAATVAGNAYTKDAADAKFETIANADKLVKTITYASGTGTFTIKTQDGTTTTIDTDIEKIPVSVSIIQSGSTYKLRITNEDGSYSECDVSALFNAVSFTDGTTIDFTTTTNSDGSKTVTAEVKDGSITGSKLDSDYKDTLDDLVTQAEAAQGAAEDAEDNAELYAGAASDSATAADGSAKDAEAWAKGTRGGTAVTSGDPTYNNNSKYYSEQAATSATGASASATEAQSYAKGSTGSRTGEDTDNSKYYKEQAALSATSASSSASSASSSKLDAEAWAVGQRNGVDVPSTDPAYQNNAKYYKDQAESIVGITVDDSLSLVSLNPVQNKVITQALNAITVPPEIFWISVTSTYDSGTGISTWSADKTLTEILTAVADGKYPIAHEVYQSDNRSDGTYYPLAYYSTGEYPAAWFVCGSESGYYAYLYAYTDNGNDVWEYTNGSITNWFIGAPTTTYSEFLSRYNNGDPIALYDNSYNALYAFNKWDGSNFYFYRVDGLCLKTITISQGGSTSYYDVDMQEKITASGLLKGNGSGGVSAATAGTDYQAPLPSQSGQSGKFLTTDGSAMSWGTVSALPSQSGQSGKFLTTNGSAASWAAVDALPSQSGQSGKFLTTNGSAASWGTPANTTYSLSISGNRITLTPSSGSATYVDLPVYNGSVV